MTPSRKDEGRKGRICTSNQAPGDAAATAGLGFTFENHGVSTQYVLQNVCSPNEWPQHIGRKRGLTMFFLLSILPAFGKLQSPAEFTAPRKDQEPPTQLSPIITVMVTFIVHCSECLMC